VEPLASPIRARFVPFRAPRTARLADVCQASRADGSAPCCSRWAAGWSCSYPRPGRASGSARAIPPRLHRGGDRVPAARRRVENWHGAVASDTARESGLCTSGVIMSQGFTVHPPYSCAPGNVQDECLTLMGVHLGGPRPTNCACWRCGPDQDFAVGGVRLWRRGGPAADDCRCRVRRRGSGRGRVPRARLCPVRLGQWPRLASGLGRG
jgi:hypothetical protein